MIFCCSVKVEQISFEWFRVTGGELFDDLVSQEDNYTEELTAKCMVQILDTMRYIHMMGVVHRDMKVSL